MIQKVESLTNKKTTGTTPQHLDHDCQQATTSTFRGLKINDIIDILKRVSRPRLIQEMANQSCKPRIRTEKMRFQESIAITQSDKIKLFKSIDSQLNNNNITSIGYDIVGLLRTNSDKKGFQSEPEGPHESLIVGRNFNKASGECEYLIRNSWGRSCAAYNYKFRCEAGNIWVPKSKLAKELFSVTYIE